MPYSKIEIPQPRELFIRQIEDQIISGKLSVGEKLPTERELETETGIKQSVIHYALKDLERMGFVTIRPRQGVYVADYMKTGSIDTLNELLRYNGYRLTLKMGTDLVELRNALEGGALIRLAEEHTPEDIAALKAAVEELRAMNEEEHTTTELADVAKKFHYLICDLCGNDIIPLIMNAFSTISNQVWKMCIRFWGVEGFIAHDEKIIELVESGKGHEAQSYIEEIFNQYLEANKQFMK